MNGSGADNRKRTLKWALTALLLGGLLLPFIPQLLWSFSQRWLFPDLLPETWGLRAWGYLLSPGTQLFRATLTSLEIGIAVTLLSLLVGLPAGRVLGLYRFRGKSIVQFIILAPAIVPGFAAAMGIHLVFIRYGLADTLPGVVLVHLIPVLPYVVLVFSGFFANFAVEMEEAARTLGATPWQVFRYVTIPALFPGIVTAALFAFMISWGQYLLTLLIGGGQVLTLPLLLLNFVNSGDYAVASALALVFIFPAAVILWAASHYLGNDTVAHSGLGRL